MNDVHDPDNPDSPAADLHEGSEETMRLLDPVVLMEGEPIDSLPTGEDTEHDEIHDGPEVIGLREEGVI